MAQTLAATTADLKAWSMVPLHEGKYQGHLTKQDSVHLQQCSRHAIASSDQNCRIHQEWYKRMHRPPVWQSGQVFTITEHPAHMHMCPQST